MASNTLGNFFTVTSFGESHGSHVGCVIDGVPSNVKIDLKKVQAQVNRRKPNSSFSTTRIETDLVEIISGIFNNKTTGAPICILIKNTNAKSADYADLKNIFRPNHADFTYATKYVNRDYNGGGRSSIRITAPMVAAGNIAEQILQAMHKEIYITAFVKAIGTVSLPESEKYFTATRKQIDKFITRIPDKKTHENANQHLEKCQTNGDTMGGIITCVMQGIPAGIGEPIFEKLSAQLAHAMLSINSVKGFEYGSGFASAQAFGSAHNDAFEINKNKKIQTKTNNSGGIQGGISNGMPIYFNTAFKPISSIAKMQNTINNKNKKSTIAIAGRHDVCAVPRAVPIVEAYAAIILLDLLIKNKITQVSF